MCGARGALLVALLLSLMVQALAVTILYCAARAISISAEPSWLQTLAAGLPAFATSLLPLPANGLGVGEAAYDIMLRTQVDAAGLPLVGGAAVYLVFRVVMLLTSLVGLPLLLVYRHKKMDS